jgi:hypothetical protein
MARSSWLTVGNAFHRLRRERVAANTFRWLRPDGCLALLWADSPWTGEQAWQKALARTLNRWTATTGISDRVPAGWEQAREQRPDAVVLGEAGFEPLGTFRSPPNGDGPPMS